MDIKEIANKTDWNTWLASQSANTFLQSWQWGQVQKADGEKVRYLGLFEETRQIGAALLITVNARRGRFLLCPHGPMFASPAQFQKHLPEFAAYAKELAQADKAVALRITPLIEEAPDIAALFNRHGFRPAPSHIHAELTWVLDITPDEEQLLQGMRKTTRHAIKKAQKVGVAIQISQDPKDLETFWPLYELTRTRHDFTPFSKKFLTAQVQEFSQDNNMYFAFAKYRGGTVAGAILIHMNNTVFYHHGASAKLPSTVPAAQLLHFEAIKEAKLRGATRYNFWGIAPDNQPGHPFAGITTFKKGFGGQARNYMHLQDLPLSLGYWKLWAVDTWRNQRRGF